MTEVKTGEENASNPNPAATDPAVQKKDDQIDVAAVAAQVLESQEQVLTQLEQTQAELAKVTGERDNYKTGLLGAKSRLKKLKKDGYIDDDDDDEQDLEGIEDRIINKIVPVIQTQIANAIPKPASQSESEIEKLRKTNSELALALKNRTQLPASPAGGNSQESPEVNKEFWTPEQKAELEKRGLDPEEVKKRALV